MKDLTNQEFLQIRDYIKKNFGINLSDEKKTLVYSRLRSVLVEKGFNNFTDYFNYLISDRTGDAVISFIDRITTNHTFFMREVDHFDYLKEMVLPKLEELCANQRDIRLWCAACSSGEEAFTLQMILTDYFKNKQPSWNTKILATDISTNVLSKAYKGIYPNEALKLLPEHWRKNYFTKYDESSSVVSDQIRNQIIFRRHNLMDKTFPFSKKLHVIFCRNVMIYFDNQTRDELVEKFYNQTEQNGYLFIGHSESLNNTATKYKYVKPAIYMKV